MGGGGGVHGDPVDLWTKSYTNVATVNVEGKL